MIRKSSLVVALLFASLTQNAQAEDCKTYKKQIATLNDQAASHEKEAKRITDLAPTATSEGMKKYYLDQAAKEKKLADAASKDAQEADTKYQECLKTQKSKN